MHKKQTKQQDHNRNNEWKCMNWTLKTLRTSYLKWFGNVPTSIVQKSKFLFTSRRLQLSLQYTKHLTIPAPISPMNFSPLTNKYNVCSLNQLSSIYRASKVDLPLSILAAAVMNWSRSLLDPSKRLWQLVAVTPCFLAWGGFIAGLSWLS